MKIYDFPYINETEIKVSENAIHLNSAWVHPSRDNKWDKHFVWELDVIQKFVDQIQDNFIVLDIGSNNGSFSLAAKYYSNTIWHCFEPDDFTFSVLKENLKINEVENIILHKEALSDKVGDSILQICLSHRGLNTLGENLQRFSPNNSFQSKVKTNTIDNLFLETKIDLIKIDTEGSEYDIIKGGKETIKKYKPKILLEYNDSNIRQCGHTIEELNSLIDEINYEVFWFDGGENVFIQSR